MGKLPNVTAEELRLADNAGSDLHQTLADLVNRCEKGYLDPVDRPIELAASFLALARAASALASQLLVKARMQEDKRELTKLLKERQELEAKNA